VSFSEPVFFNASNINAYASDGTLIATARNVVRISDQIYEMDIYPVMGIDEQDGFITLTGYSDIAGNTGIPAVCNDPITVNTVILYAVQVKSDFDGEGHVIRVNDGAYINYMQLVAGKEATVLSKFSDPVVVFAFPNGGNPQLLGMGSPILFQ